MTLEVYYFATYNIGLFTRDHFAFIRAIRLTNRQQRKSLRVFSRYYLSKRSLRTFNCYAYSLRTLSIIIRTLTSGVPRKVLRESYSDD